MKGDNEKEIRKATIWIEQSQIILINFVSLLPPISMKRRKLLSFLSVFCLSLILSVSCSQTPQSTDTNTTDTPDTAANSDEPAVVIGYSNWAGWWPWAIAEQEGLFAKNNANVELRWFDGYLASMEALAAGQLDGNCQTLNDTISFAENAVLLLMEKVANASFS